MDLFLSVLGRIIVAALACLAAIVPIAVIGMGGGSGKEAIFIFALVFFFGLGWTLLPVALHSKALTRIVVGLWVALVIPLAFFGSSDAQGWMLLPWALASAFLNLQSKGKVKAMLFDPNQVK